MRIGVDFDNTIVCYDDVFPALAHERGLVPSEIPRTKGAVRDHLRAIGREDDWTELQGFGYGPGILRAPMFDGFLQFVERARARDVPVFIVSHKTKHPFRGPAFDLHESARQWLRANGIVGGPSAPLSEAEVHLELTKPAKLERIAKLDCTHFIDDLPEFLSEKAFPAETRKILFDPHDANEDAPAITRCRSWQEITRVLLGGID